MTFGILSSKTHLTAVEDLKLSGYLESHNIYGLKSMAALNQSAVEIYARAMDKYRKWL